MTSLHSLHCFTDRTGCVASVTSKLTQISSCTSSVIGKRRFQHIALAACLMLLVLLMLPCCLLSPPPLHGPCQTCPAQACAALVQLKMPPNIVKIVLKCVWRALSFRGTQIFSHTLAARQTRVTHVSLREGTETQQDAELVQCMFMWDRERYEKKWCQTRFLTPNYTG